MSSSERQSRGEDEGEYTEQDPLNENPTEPPAGEVLSVSPKRDQPTGCRFG